jgi:cell division protein FtsQ
MTAKSEKRAEARKSPARKRPVPAWRTRRAIVGFSTLAAAVVLGAGVWLWHGGYVGRSVDAAYARFIDATVKHGLVVREVLVSGRKETERAALLNAVGLVRGAPILDFSVVETKKRIEALPWVRTVSVRRALPDTVIVDVVERRPLALWQKHGVFRLIDHDGQVIRDDDVGRFQNLLVVVGEGAPAHAAELIEILDSRSDLRRRVEAAVWVGERRWNVRFDNGIDVRLPEQDPAGAWARLAEYERSHRVLARDVRVLDMRLPDRLVVRKPGEPEPKPRAPGRET